MAVLRAQLTQCKVRKVTPSGPAIAQPLHSTELLTSLQVQLLFKAFLFPLGTIGAKLVPGLCHKVNDHMGVGREGKRHLNKS